METLITLGGVLLYLGIGFAVSVFLRIIDKDPKPNDDDYYFLAIFIWPFCLFGDGMVALIAMGKGSTRKLAEIIKPGCTVKPSDTKQQK